MKYFLPFVLILLGLSFYKPNREIRFSPKLKPNSIYTMNYVAESKSIINFDGPKEILEKIKANGTGLPLVEEIKKEFTVKTITDSLDEDNMFGLRMEYEKIKIIKKINGKEEQIVSPLSGLVVIGKYTENNKIKIDSVISSYFDKQSKNILKKMAEEIQNSIKFPDHPLKIGDEFEQKVPVNFPMEGLSQMKMMIISKYKLIEIKDDKAIFDIKQTLSLDSKTDKWEVHASGVGGGIAVYDLKQTYIIRNDTDLEMDMTVKLENLTMNGKSKTKIKQDIKIERR
ncbi:MAG: hypothetical protein GXO24_01225 [Chlorobi bacterium]|nr:hypothetical protein [Chlorobiota bacterium]